MLKTKSVFSILSCIYFSSHTAIIFTHKETNGNNTKILQFLKLADTDKTEGRRTHYGEP